MTSDGSPRRILGVGDLVKKSRGRTLLRNSHLTKCVMGMWRGLRWKDSQRGAWEGDEPWELCSCAKLG